MDESAQDIDQLPESWSLCAIDDITTPIAKADPKKEPYRNITYLDISGIDNVSNRIAETKSFRFSDAPSRARQIVKSGDVLFSTVRPYLRNIAQVPAEFDGEIASTGFSILRAAPGIEPSFLYLKALSKQFVDALSGEQYGVSYPAVKDAQVRAQPIAVPPSNEQRRIVEKIEALFAQLDKGEEAVREVQKLLTHYRQSILKSAVTGQLTADWRGQHDGRQKKGGEFLQHVLDIRSTKQTARRSAPVEPRNSTMPELPREWCWASLDELIYEGPTNGTSPKATEDGAGVQSFKLTATTSGYFIIDETTVKMVDAEVDPASKYWLKSGDVLIQRGNTIEYLGTAAIFPGPDDEYIYPDLMMRLRFVDKLLARWSVLWINFEYAKRYFRESATGTAGNMPKINGTTLKSLAIPLPPRSEIETILAIVKKMFGRSKPVEDFCAAELARSVSLRQSILKEAFAGRLVPQDATDEPASELLSRIKADKAPSKNTRREILA